MDKVRGILPKGSELGRPRIPTLAPSCPGEGLFGVGAVVGGANSQQIIWEFRQKLVNPKVA